MKAKTVRLLAGGLAAITLMSSTAVMPVFADEAHTVNSVATEAVADNSHVAETKETVQKSDSKETQVSDASRKDAETQNKAATQTAEETAGAQAAQSKAVEADTKDAKASQDKSEDQTAEVKTEAEASEETGTEAASADKAEKTGEKETEKDVKDVKDAKSEKDSDLLSGDIDDEPELGAAAPAEGAKDEKKDEKDDEAARAQKEKETQEFLGWFENIYDRAGVDLYLQYSGGRLPSYSKRVEMYLAFQKNLPESQVRALKATMEAAERLEKGTASIDDVMNIIDRIDTAKIFPEVSKASVNGTSPSKTQDNTSEKVYQVMRQTYGNIIGKTLGNVPYVKFVADPVKSLILHMIGLGKEHLVPQKTNAQLASDLSNKIDEAKNEIKRAIETVPSIKEYGVRLDAFTTSSTTMAQKVEDYKNDKTLTENEKAVKIAALLGHSSTWEEGNSNILNQMHYAAQSMRSKSKNGPKADLHARNMFEVFYDYNKETSMFSGEAMDKSDKAIRLRIAEYAESCKVLAEVLRAHEKVAGMTSEEAAALSASVKTTYNRIKCDKKDIRTQMNDIIATFTGKKTSGNQNARYGILDAAKDYYSKDRLIFIEKNGDKFNEIQLNPKVSKLKSEFYGHGGENFKKESALNGDQIRKLQAHANSLGMTMCEYLEKMGFDMKDVKETNRLAILSTIRDESTGYLSGRRGTGTLRDFYYGFDMKAKGATEQRYEWQYFNRPSFKWPFTSDKSNDEEILRNTGLLFALRPAETKANTVKTK